MKRTQPNQINLFLIHLSKLLQAVLHEIDLYREWVIIQNIQNTVFKIIIMFTKLSYSFSISFHFALKVSS